MKLTLLGTGTSHGIPVIACTCAVCRSQDERDKRTRCGAYIEIENGSEKKYVAIDTSPEFRVQALKFGIEKLDALLVTHGHADHLNGLDDVRIFSHTDSADKKYGTTGNGLKVYANASTIRDIHHRFDYIFHQTQLGGGKPKIDVHNSADFDEGSPIKIGSASILPIPLLHGKLETTGWLLYETAENGERKSLLYLTDCNEIPESSINLIKNNAGTIEHAVIDGLRENIHATHFSFLQAMEAGAVLGAKNVWLTHITHDLSYADIKKYCADHSADTQALAEATARGTKFCPSHDGLVLEV